MLSSANIQWSGSHVGHLCIRCSLWRFMLLICKKCLHRIGAAMRLRGYLGPARHSRALQGALLCMQCLLPSKVWHVHNVWHRLRIGLVPTIVSCNGYPR